MTNVNEEKEHFKKGIEVLLGMGGGGGVKFLGWFRMSEWMNELMNKGKNGW